MCQLRGSFDGNSNVPTPHVGDLPTKFVQIAELSMSLCWILLSNAGHSDTAVLRLGLIIGERICNDKVII